MLAHSIHYMVSYEWRPLAIKSLVKTLVMWSSGVVVNDVHTQNCMRITAPRLQSGGTGLNEVGARSVRSGRSGEIPKYADYSWTAQDDAGVSCLRQAL